MDRMLYLAASGARQILEAQTVTANNLANVSTTGFQADLSLAQAQQVYGPGHASRVYAVNAGEGVDFSKGTVQSTGRSLDVAINGQGWIAVQAADGSEAYTRAGDLRISASGMLETGTGLAVIGDGGPMLIPDAQQIEIAPDGTVSVLPIGQPANTLAVVGRIKLVQPDPAQLVKGEDGLLRLADGSEAEASNAVTLTSGALEGSNVNAVEALMNMVSLARQYEAQVKLMQTAKQNDESSARLMSINS
ncbi:flagellar basal-body rod protein FlgF [Thiohalobacter sp. IOR34]|uniref:flagellar basal-body rod protein FlgF n=1 Tax=Thiohalobacter sp. IOR34 TaxID=3057176 RepID=UPI0025B24E88|nr:flagellar basal-body rod protein FlgF [Thiohalobacter sp. IOR34]WJW74610.1 flagellar basal-body rod protein FlgF [Thiohalobacter sp. IOR34]